MNGTHNTALGMIARKQMTTNLTGEHVLVAVEITVDTTETATIDDVTN